MSHNATRIRCLAVVALTLAALPLSSLAQHYLQTNLVADQSGAAAATDANLVNPWGMARSSGSPWWLSDNGTGLSTSTPAQAPPKASSSPSPPAIPP